MTLERLGGGEEGGNIEINPFEELDGGGNTEINPFEGSDGGEEGGSIEMTPSEGSGGEDEMTEDPGLVELRKSICNGDREAVEQFFDQGRPLGTIILSNEGYTALHVAILAGQYGIAKNLIEKMSLTDLEIKTASDSGGHTVLTLVATTGRTDLAMDIVHKDNDLLVIENGRGYIPVTAACNVGHKKMTEYLYSVTPLEVLASNKGKYGFDLLRAGMDNNFLGICLHQLQCNPKLIVAPDKEMLEFSPIFILSRQPDAFYSGSKLRFWHIWIYCLLKVEMPTISFDDEVRMQFETLEEKTSKYKRFTPGAFGQHLTLCLMPQNFPGIKKSYDLKSRHIYSNKILQCMCKHISTLKVQSLRNCGVADAMFKATEQGNVEIVVELLKVIKPLIFYNDDGRHVFMIAIQSRQENIFSLLYGINEGLKAHILNQTDKKRNNMLHVAGEKAPPSQDTRICSPALHLQREVKWFKEVERIVPEWCKESKNNNGETPHEVFLKSHEDLVNEGEKWIRNMANSFIVAATLIITVTFAAACAFPGGNAENGSPNFLNKGAFMIFIIFDGISFFTASASVLMFMGILASGFTPVDFLESLPRKLIGFVSTTLFSIAAMAVSFSAALWIVLQHRLWAIIPIIIMAGIPILLFVRLQYPLLAELFISTYNTELFFKRKMKLWL
ncbi:hypothetical protein SLEP1_g10019 [Rubroshorea leprosula]|uniref:PGG domain-containing protein n=1 Tax=Rubroshorea leprosula TaxID=152421 RepID=A0AAV5IG63_9ROSI|nr:hypothetical protein SLEP1_g10019 [Rubroshorea leprosula]